MTQEFNACLSRGKIKEFSPGHNLFAKELSLAGEDLINAQDSFRDNKFKWSIIQSYYSMFHSARALLYFKNYREKSHYCLIEAIRHLYVNEKLLPTSILEGFIEAKNLRESADYYGDFSEINAAKLIQKAEMFINTAKALTNK